jgi:hypothetical protein
MTYNPVISGVLVLSLGTIPFAYGLDSRSDQERFTQQIAAQMSGVESGSVADQATTTKQRNPAKDQRADQNAQVTLGGAKSFVSGEIRKVEGDYYFINDDEQGDEVRLLVTKDANLDCSAAPTPTQSTLSTIVETERMSAALQAPDASDRQKEQGQKKDETAMGSGFRIGACSFKPGDRITAEVDDMGRVTTFRFIPSTMSTEPRTARSLGESAGTGELAIPGKQDKPGQLDMTGPHGYPPKQYAILPVPVGELKSAGRDSLLHSPVKNPDGVLLGSLESLIMDSNTGQIEYAVVLLNDTNTLETVPWVHMKVQRDTDTSELVVDTRHYQVSPDLTNKEMVDRSPELERIKKDMQSAKAPEDLRDAEGGEGKTHVKKSKRSPEACANNDCRVIRGRVLQREGESLTVKENSGSGKEVRVTMDRKTQKGQVGIAGRDEEFAVGDTIEAYVTSTGHAESISLMRPDSAGRPEEAGG